MTYRRRRKRAFLSASASWIYAQPRTVPRYLISFVDSKLQRSEQGFNDTFRMTKDTFLSLCSLLENNDLISQHLRPVRGRHAKYGVTVMLSIYVLRVCQGMTYRMLEDTVGMYTDHFICYFCLCCPLCASAI